ncbi:MAG: murein L,D-transpeptidase family protein [Rubritalea sp.]|uniref:L,D-transpeptidase family protein n=1 Tax=Rubritalea sp. TaxID=2109375 RepID=UPI0032428F45
MLGIVCTLYSRVKSETLSIPTTIRKLIDKNYSDGHKRAAAAAERVTPALVLALHEKKLSIGSPVFIRIFKETNELELWVESTDSKKFKLFRSYTIAGMSGHLGPKLAEGDLQAPEGFYAVSRRLMNPQSRYHLAFNIGYPNTYDRAHNYTGSAIMVHGSTCSIGCFAMTNEKIEEIYTLCDAALNNGQAFFRVHSFPFRLTDEKLATVNQQKWHAFWKELQPGYLHFENHQRPPNVTVNADRYVFENE